MFKRGVFVFLLICIISSFSVFGQSITEVKEFERVRRTVPISISLNIFGFGIGSFLQGDLKSALIQLGISTAGYALIFSGIFGNFGTRTETYSNGYGGYYEDIYENTGPKNALIGLGSVILAGNAFFGAYKAINYQFDKKFDLFYDINNDIKWPGGF